MAKVKTRYVCQNCGYISPRLLGRCPNCGAWNQLVEELEPQKVIAPVTPNFAGETKQPVKLSEITFNEEKRVHTGLTELDRVLGGGVVPGSLVLIGGDPGIGKSTLLLQVSGQLEQTGGQVLYVTGEESASQIKLRANRLHVQGKELFIYPETDMNAVTQMVQQQKPDYLIIDSVQTMNIPDLSSAIGSVAQVRAVTSQLMTIAKQQGVTVFVVGHVTKGGAIAGPKILEHMVDTVLYFEGDLHHNYRILRSVKNRFGSTNEIGMFAMQDDGLKEVANPSEIFLEERLAHATGSAVVVSMEGTRPILVEIQSLITPTLYGMAKRTTTGLDHNRVAVIMAVLEKRANILLQNQDAYLKATGGVHLDEPAIDLAMAMAIVSSYRNLGLAADECFVGEIGLTGEIRRVNLIDQRIKEAAKLGFQRIYVPANNEVNRKNQHQIEIVGVRTINDAIKKVFKNQR
ncbi:DNA repair protein RadA [Bombilactobacillus mellis]|uniref:DNA repair protein RadA n=1 Tax=Bombilactobacillus mellis TaxID=1218508 RepID=UPI00224688FC|nr:DNA repair protein RadA [Bombilactobacillus mellis]MCX0279755.1 DNA repair protein RadA [Bombilactobacillus mellis]